jgi:hypothetical protein
MFNSIFYQIELAEGTIKRCRYLQCSTYVETMRFSPWPRLNVFSVFLLLPSFWVNFWRWCTDYNGQAIARQTDAATSTQVCPVHSYFLKEENDCRKSPIISNQQSWVQYHTRGQRLQAASRWQSSPGKRETWTPEYIEPWSAIKRRKRWLEREE